jgi:hypothetical protein
MPYIKTKGKDLELLKQMFMRQLASNEAMSEDVGSRWEELFASTKPEPTEVEKPLPEVKPEPVEPYPYTKGGEGGGGAEPIAKSQQPAKPQLTKTKPGAAYPGAPAFVEGMIKRGWTPEEAAGAAGNVHVESGFRPEIKSSVPGENSYGFLQWNKERLRGLKNMAAATSRDWTDPDVQMDYIHAERTGESVKYGGADERTAYKRALAGGGTAAEIAERFGRFVERPADLSQSVRTRRQMAEMYMPTKILATAETNRDDQILASIMRGTG